MPLMKNADLDPHIGPGFLRRHRVLVFGSGVSHPFIGEFCPVEAFVHEIVEDELRALDRQLEQRIVGIGDGCQRMAIAVDLEGVGFVSLQHADIFGDDHYGCFGEIGAVFDKVDVGEGDDGVGLRRCRTWPGRRPTWRGLRRCYDLFHLCRVNNEIRGDCCRCRVGEVDYLYPAT